MNTENRPALSESSENYLEAILQLETRPGEAVRSVDIANKMSVSRASVSKAMYQLRDAGMVEFDPYGLVSLTAPGRRIAAEILERHLMLRRFLTQVLGVEEAVADEEACRMEHVISPRYCDPALRTRQADGRLTKNARVITCASSGRLAGPAVSTRPRASTTSVPAMTLANAA